MKCDRCDNTATVHEVSIKGGKKVERHLCEGCAKAEGMPGNAATPIVQMFSKFLAAQGAPMSPMAAAAQGGAAADPRSPAACPGCGLTFAQFRQAGLMGCAGCYAAFEGQLGPLLARAHEGGTNHVGKLPARPRGAEGTADAGATSPDIGTGTESAGGARGKARAITPPAGHPASGGAGGVGGAGEESSPTAARTREADAAALQRVAALRKQLLDAVSGEQYERAAKLRDELARLSRGRPVDGGGGPDQGGATT